VKYFRQHLILHESTIPQPWSAYAQRAMVWFCRIIVSSNSADYTNPKAVRASMGSLFHLTIIPEIDLSVALPEIKKHFFLIVLMSAMVYCLIRFKKRLPCFWAMKVMACRRLFKNYR